MSESAGIGEFLAQTVASVEDVVQTRLRRLRRRLGDSTKPTIVPYTGYANVSRAWFHGRVLTNPPRDVPDEDDGWWKNLAAMYRRLESDEVPGAAVEIDFGGTTHTVVTDAEGYFHLEAAAIDGVANDGLWTSAAMRLADRRHTSLVTARLMTPDPSTPLAIISDVDDTVLHTDAANLLSMARHTFFHNARTRKPLAGAAAWYRALQGGPDGRRNPIFYVSSSPWNLHDLIEDFLDLNDIPHGPVLLRDIGVQTVVDVAKELAGGRAGGHDHKLEKALRVMAAFPNTRFVLIGDSGQEDARLYAEAASQRGQQIAAIFIRDVDPALASHHDDAVGAAAQRCAAAGVPMHLVADSLSAARICADAGLIPAATLPAIQRDTRRDEER